MLWAALYTLLFVSSVYVWKILKRALGMQKNDRLKIVFVTIAVGLTFYISYVQHCNSLMECISLDISINNLIYTIGLNTMLFLGPLYQNYMDGTLSTTFELNLSNLQQRKKIIYAPLLEEIAFRVAIFNGCDNNFIWISAIYFSLAHAHLYFRLMKKSRRWEVAAMKTIFILSYTFVFGLYSAVVFDKTRSLMASIILHSYCNIMQVPKFEQIYNRPKYQGHLLLAIYIIGVVLFFIII